MATVVPGTHPRQNSGLDDVIQSIADSKMPPMKKFKQEDALEGIDSDSLSTSPAPSESHLGPPPPGSQYFSCPQCQKVFWSETSLKHHSSLYHSEKAFVCEICNKAFRFRSNLAEHRSVHTALKPYVCKFCGKSSRLKGNLTKHILKHHKKEQNAFIGKDDIIIKKGKKSVKDPIAVDFLEKSMIVLTESSPTSSTPTPSQTPNTTCSSINTSSAALQLFTIAQMAGAMGSNCSNPLLNLSSLVKPEEDDGGEEMDGGVIGYSMDHKSILSDSHIPVEATPLFGNNSLLLDDDNDDDRSSGESEVVTSSICDSSTPSNTSTRLLNCTPMSQGGTRCHLCGKHFRKTQNLQLHMTLKHGHAPPGSEQQPPEASGIMESNPNLNSPPPLKVGNQALHSSLMPPSPSLANGTVLGGDLRELKDLLKELRSVSNGDPPPSSPQSHISNLAPMQSNNQVTDSAGDGRLETLLVTLDGRVARLEKQVETSLNSLYTLVQLQSTMNTAFSKFRDEVTMQLRALQALRGNNDSFD